MFKFVLIFALSIGLIFSLADVEGQQALNVSANPAKSNFGTNEPVIIRGSLQSEDGKPMADADIVAGFPGGSVKTLTDDSGFFEIRKESVGPGIYSVGVIASKDGFGTDSTNSKIIVTKDPATKLASSFENTVNTISEGTKTVPKTVNNLSGSITDGITKNPVSEKILKQIEEFKKQQEVLKNQQEKQKNIQNSRDIAKQKMDEELNSLKKSHESNNPENAFTRFVEGMDSTVKQIFLGQFKLTLEKHNEAKKAKENALASGASFEDAMKQFQRKAAISRSEIIEHNKQLNIEHGKADEKIQSQFDEKGKLPREN